VGRRVAGKKKKVKKVKKVRLGIRETKERGSRTHGGEKELGEKTGALISEQDPGWGGKRG